MNCNYHVYLFNFRMISNHLTKTTTCRTLPNDNDDSPYGDYLADKSFDPDEPVINVHHWLMRRVYRYETRDHPVLWVKAHSTTYDELGNPHVKEMLLTHYNPCFIGDLFSPGSHVELQVRYVSTIMRLIRTRIICMFFLI